MVEYIILGMLVVFLVYLISRFRPCATGPVTGRLFAVRSGFVNFYLLRTQGGAVLFDTGVSAAAAKRGLRKIGVEPDEVTHIFLTHTDYDHAGGISAFPNAVRYISAGEEQMIDGRTARKGFMHNRPFRPYTTLEDGESVIVGGSTVEMRLTPGHTTGSAVYLVDGSILVCGDLLRVTKDGGVRPFMRLMNMDHKRDIQSVREIMPLVESARCVLTGHTGYRLAGAAVTAPVT